MHFVFVDLKAGPGSAYLAVRWRCPSLKGVLEKFISLIYSPYLSNRGRVHVYDDVLPDFTMRSGVPQGRAPSIFLIRFDTEMIVEISV